MSTQPQIRLTYFDARGRAQFARAFLHARGIEFEDERVPLDEGYASWRAMREDRAQSGPLQRLPVLHHGERLVPETFVIAGFLHRTFGDAADLNATENLHHDVLVSCALTDLLSPIAMLVWSDLIYPGADLGECARGSLVRFGRTLDVLEHALGEWGWVDSAAERPVTVADCLLWEQLDLLNVLFGPHLTLDGKPHLQRFRHEYRARESFESLLRAHPSQITGRAGESEVIQRIQAALDTGGPS